MTLVLVRLNTIPHIVELYLVGPKNDNLGSPHKISLLQGFKIAEKVEKY